MATIPLGEYLWRRLHQVGVETIMGLPGDFNLQLLDHIYNVKGLRWIGTGNELNAAYAVDGYARIKNAPGCIVTTHGVGELSGLNGIAGALTEQVKVIHVVGQTTRPMQKNHLMIHHSIGFNPDHQIFTSASKRFRVADTLLMDIEGATAEIDRVIRECFLKSGPVYIFLPLDLVDEHVSSDPLNTPLDLSPSSPTQSKSTAESAASAIAKAITEAKQPAIFVDVLLQRHGAVNEIRELVNQLKFPVFHSGIGMGIIDSKSENLVGLYNGGISSPGINEYWESCDLLLIFGRLPADTNSGGFSQVIPMGKTIEFKPDEVDFRGLKSYPGLYYRDFLPFLTTHLSKQSLPKATIPRMPTYNLTPADDTTSQVITTPWFWPKFSTFLQSGDSIVADTGTSLFGILDCDLPSDFTYNSQTYYGSIGYATPSALGAELARQELAATNPHSYPSRSAVPSVPKRTILLTGDGSIQLTVQEIGTMIMQRAAPVIVIINNNGYTVERAIHGAKQAYNDIAQYDWSKMLAFFGMPAAEAEKSYVKCTTREEFEEVCKREDFRRPERVMVLEVVMDAFDAPWRMLNAIARRGEAYAQEMVEGGFTMRKAVVVDDKAA